MAQGMEVLQAAWAGKQVRHPHHGVGRWLRWDGHGFTFVDTGIRFIGLCVTSLWQKGWEIEEDRPLTADEAWTAAMNGHVVSGGQWEYRVTHEADGSQKIWSREKGDPEWWAVPSVDWRIVDETPTADALREPNLAELTRVMARNAAPYSSGGVPSMPTQAELLLKQFVIAERPERSGEDQ